MGILVPDSYERYTKSEQKIMEFIEQRTDEFLFMSIGQLAEKLNVSEATISRFVRHIGYSDFKEMKNEIIQQKSDKGPVRKVAGTLLKDQGFDLKKWIAFQAECMEKTLEHMDFSQFYRAIVQIQKAKRIYIHAKNASACAGQLLFFRLRRLGFCVSLIPSGGSEVIEGIAHAGEGDLVIIFSYSKVSKEGQMILDYAKEAGYDTLAFTSRLHAPCEQRADENLYVYRGEQAEYHSMTAAIALIDGLILALSEQMHSESAEKLGKIEKLKKYYQK